MSIQIDILVNNAGITIDRTAAKCRMMAGGKVVAVDLSGAFCGLTVVSEGSHLLAEPGEATVNAVTGLSSFQALCV